MSDLAKLPLATSRLIELRAPIDCLVCGEENNASAERCRRCSAPIALALHTASEKRIVGGRRATHLIAVVAAPGAGKTVYLGMLMDMLVRGVSGLRATLHGPLSVSMQEAAVTALASGVFPEKTPVAPEHWRWSHCRIECRRRRRATDIVLSDIAGDVWAQEAEQPGRWPALSALLDRASAVIVLADAQRLHAGDHADDFITLKLFSALDERRLAARPLAFVLTKADGCPGAIENPQEFAETHAEGVIRDCQARFSDCRVFGSTVAGATAWREAAGRRRSVPLRIEPQGVVEPLGWLLTQLPRRPQ